MKLGWPFGQPDPVALEKARDSANDDPAPDSKTRLHFLHHFGLTILDDMESCACLDAGRGGVFAVSAISSYSRAQRPISFALCISEQAYNSIPNPGQLGSLHGFKLSLQHNGFCPARTV
jgi:hypothetical protein